MFPYIPCCPGLFLILWAGLGKCWLLWVVSGGAAGALYMSNPEDYLFDDRLLDLLWKVIYVMTREGAPILPCTRSFKYIAGPVPATPEDSGFCPRGRERTQSPAAVEDSPRERICLCTALGARGSSDREDVRAVAGVGQLVRRIFTIVEVYRNAVAGGLDWRMSEFYEGTPSELDATCCNNVDRVAVSDFR